MTSSGSDNRSPRSTAITALGVDHVRLSYHYLDIGDIDAFGSLLDENIQIKRPDTPPGQGRAEALTLHARLAGPPSRHRIYKVVADGDSVAVLGRFTGRGATPAGGDPLDIEFVDFFTLSSDGLLLDCRRFYFLAPR